MGKLKLTGYSSIGVPDRRFWGTTKGLTAYNKAVSGGTELSSMYSFSIFDLEKFEIADVGTYQIDPANRTKYALFQFPTPPSQYEISEPAATTIIPTQDGGVFVESHGSIFKDIRISGTVGLRPNVPSTELFGGLQESTGVSIEYPSTLQSMSNDDRGLSRKEATGFDDIIFLRNLFRFYMDCKRDPFLARKTALVWVYAKESEAYIIEPISFVTNRDSKNPLSWNYTIQVRSLMRLNTTFRAVADPINIFSALSKGLQAFHRLALDLSRALNSIVSVINFVTRLPMNIMGTIVGGGIEVLNGLAAVKNSTKLNKLSEGTVREWGVKLREAVKLLADEEEKSGGGSVAPVSWQLYNVGLARKALRDMWKVSNLLLSLDYLWADKKGVEIADYSKAYKDAGGNPPLTSGSPLNVANISLPSGASSDTILGGEDIRTIARRLTGDEANWKKLVLMNNLRAPYISAERTDGVLGYGDQILVPKDPTAKDSSTQVTRQLDEDAAFQALPKIRRRYGRDLMLVDATSGDGVADVAVNQRGDLMTIEDEANVHQAMMIKMSTEQGELPTHPTFGAKYPIGSKFPTLSRLQEFILNAQGTFLQDPRVNNVVDIKTFVVGDKIIFNAKLQLIASDEKLPITFSVRR
jgi:hypothetical protein